VQIEDYYKLFSMFSVSSAIMVAVQKLCKPES